MHGTSPRPDPWIKRLKLLGLPENGYTLDERLGRFFAGLFERSPFPLLALNKDKLVAFWNPAAESLFGWSEEELLGKPYPLVPPGEQARFNERWAGLLAGEGTAGRTVTRVRRDGSPVTVSLTTTPLLDPAGRVIGAMGSMTDLSEQERMREREASHDRDMRQLLENTLDIVLVLADDGRILYLSPSAKEIMGHDPVEKIGTDSRPNIHPDDQARSDEILRQAREKPGIPKRYELRIRHQDGSWRTLESICRHLPSERPGAGRTLINARDVTDQRLLQAELLQAQKMEGIGRLAGGIAHDFNNLLTVLLGNAELMRDTLDAEHPLQREVSELIEASNRAAGLTRQLLSFSRRQIVQPRPVALDALVLGMSKMLRRIIGEDVELVLLPEAKEDAVLADPGQLEQVLVNLAVNARDAMPDGGKLILRTARLARDAESLRAFPWVAAGEFLALVVEDTGTGIAPEALGHLFEPFFTTKPQGKGTGLGLATCYGIVRQSGGFIEISSAPGRGTAFTVSLPLCMAASAAQAPVGGEEPLPHGRETILVAEDEPMVRRLIVRTLMELGYKVLAAANGEEALRLLNERGNGGVDMLISDLVMPRLGGLELSRRFRAERPGVPVLLTSGYSELTVEPENLEQDGMAFIPKPFHASSLARKVRESLDRAR